MIRLEINGSQREEDLTAYRSMGEMLEFVKSQIDPDTMIVSLLLDGQELTDSEWNAPFSAGRDRILQIQTGTKKDYIKQRLNTAPTLVEQISVEFGNAGQAYQSGSNIEGNTKFSLAVKDLGAFVRWYNSLLGMDSALETQLKGFIDQVSSLQGICEQLHKQQVIQSWWSAGDMINQKLRPKLEEIKNYCQDTSNR